MKAANLIVLGATVVSAAQPHRHAHRHADIHHADAVHKRADVTTTQVAVVTEYQLQNGKIVDAGQVASGLAEGIYVLLSDSPPAAATSIRVPNAAPPASSTSSPEGAEFFQKVSSSSSSSSSSSPPPPPPSSSSTPPPPASSSSAPASSSQASSSASSSDSFSSTGGSSSSFPSGISCNTFPSQYGAVPVEYLGLLGYTGIQCPEGGSSWNIASTTSFENIVTLNSGATDYKGCFLSFACAAGQLKCQYPTSQGGSGQSMGGVFCNEQGTLELTNPDCPTLCIEATCNVFVTSHLNQVDNICRTDYPGTEAETLPLTVQPGATLPLACPDATTYYHWQGGATSAQYYVNNEGVPVNEACCWGEAGSNMGNWAPMNWGVGKSSSGVFLSMFPNTPTNPLSVTLNFNVEIVGDVSADCKYVDGVYYMNGSPSTNGCTVGVTPGGKATFVLTERGS